MTYEIDMKKTETLLMAKLKQSNDEYLKLESMLANGSDDIEQLHVLKIIKKGEMKAIREEIQKMVTLNE